MAKHDGMSRRQLIARIEELERELAESKRLPGAMIAALSNENLEPEARIVYVHLVLHIDQEKAAGRVTPDGYVAVDEAEMERQLGLHPGAAWRRAS